MSLQRSSSNFTITAPNFDSWGCDWNAAFLTTDAPALQAQSFEVEGNIELLGTGNKDASLWIFRKPLGSQTWDSTLLATTTIGGSFSYSFSVGSLIPCMVVWKTTKNTTLKLTSYTLKKGGASVQIGNFISPVIVKPSYDGWTIDTKTQLLRKTYISNSNQLIPGVQKTFSTTASTTYRFSVDIGYLSSGGGGIGMGVSSPNESLDGDGNPISAFAFNFYDSIIVYKMIGTQQTRITAKRYNGTGPVDITFSAPSSQTKVEFVPGNVVSTTYAYYVDNMRLSTVTGSVIYTSNFISNTIVSQNTDGWASNWASSYMNVSSGSLNQLQVSGTAPSVQRIFTNVQANNEHTLTYMQSQNNAVQLVVEQSPNGTTWSTLLNTTTSNGTQTHTFTPTQIYLRARFSASASFQVSEILLNGIEVDMVVNVTPGGFAKYRYGFQNQEVDDEIKGVGNSVNYKYRMHDPRIGRFFAVDPLASKYPHNSPYAFSENVVINAVELEGLEKHELSNGETVSGPYSGNYIDNFNNGYNKVKNKGLISNDIYNFGSYKKEESIVGNYLAKDIQKLGERPKDYTPYPNSNKEGVEPTKQAATAMSNPGSNCYVVTAARVNKAYTDLYGVTPIDFAQNADGTYTSESYKTSSAQSGQQNYEFAVGGALVNQNYGTLVDSDGVWSGELKKGAVIQYWRSTDQSNLTSNGGHSQIFLNYTYDQNNQVNGMVLFDNSGYRSAPKNKVSERTYLGTNIDYNE